MLPKLKRGYVLAIGILTVAYFFSYGVLRYYALRPTERTQAWKMAFWSESKPRLSSLIDTFLFPASVRG